MSSSSVRRAGVRRVGVLAGPVLVGAFVLASCGAADDAATQSTIDLSAASTAFVVRTPATTVPVEEAAAVEAGVVAGTQDYVVQAGDYPYKLVNDFGITLEDLIAVNEWASEKEFPGPGTTILIPPGALNVAAAPVATTAPDAAATADPAVTIPDAGDNCGQGTYTIVAGDLPGRVATKFDVTLEALNAANASTRGYAGFVVGIEIVIPAKADC